MVNHMKTKNKKEWMPAFMLAAFLLILWQLAACIIGKSHILPGPVEIVKRTWELRASLLLHHLPTTLVTILTGWTLAIAVGVLLAVLMDASHGLRSVIYPVLVVTQTVPVMCISPLFVLWLGYTVQARLLAVVLSTFFSITLNTLKGFDNADRRKLELLKTYGASLSQIFFRLKVPAALPGFMTSLKMTLPWAVIDAAVAEWLGATEGLGYFSKRMVSKMDGAAVFAPVLVLCVLSLSGMALIQWLDRKLVPWRGEN